MAGRRTATGTKIGEERTDTEKNYHEKSSGGGRSVCKEEDERGPRILRESTVLCGGRRR